MKGGGLHKGGILRPEGVRCGKAHRRLSRAAQAVREVRECLGRCTGVYEWSAQPKWRALGEGARARVTYQSHL